MHYLILSSPLYYVYKSTPETEHSYKAVIIPAFNKCKIQYCLCIFILMLYYKLDKLLNMRGKPSRYHMS